MHGKINYYSSKAGVGSIVNNLKKAFDFRDSNWHDTSTIPSKDMYIVYLLDEKGRLTGVQSSKYQNFKDHPFLHEADFWATDDDLQLEELEEKRREELVNSTMKELTPGKISSVEATLEMEECARLVFSKHFNVLEQEGDIFDSDVKFEFDYLLLKRFLEKTILQLTTLDKRVSGDEFLDIRQKIVEVEYLLNSLIKIADPNGVELTKNYFLKYQIEYTAIKRVAANLNDAVKMFSNRSKNLESEIKSLQGKIDGTSGALKSKFEAELDRKTKEKAEADSELKSKMPVLEKLQQLIVAFEKKYQTDFPRYYLEQKEMLKTDIKQLLNLLADSLDTKLYEIASRSEAVALNFYSKNIEGTFSTMTFVRYYFARLNKELMQEGDKVFYKMLLEYEKAMTINVAVITENVSFGQSVKLAVLAQSKHVRVIMCLRAIEFMSLCDKESFALIMIDTKLRDTHALELIEKGKASKKNSSAEYIVFDSRTGV